MENTKKEQEKIIIICAFIPAVIAACVAIGYTIKVWPALLQQPQPAIECDTLLPANASQDPC